MLTIINRNVGIKDAGFYYIRSVAYPPQLT